MHRKSQSNKRKLEAMSDAWSVEDEKLFDSLVKDQNGWEINWNEVALRFSDRTVKQCWEKYIEMQEYLKITREKSKTIAKQVQKPRATKGFWKDTEDEILKQSVQQFINQRLQYHGNKLQSRYQIGIPNNVVNDGWKI